MPHGATLAGTARRRQQVRGSVQGSVKRPRRRRTGERKRGSANLRHGPSHRGERTCEPPTQSRCDLDPSAMTRRTCRAVSRELGQESDRKETKVRRTGRADFGIRAHAQGDAGSRSATRLGLHRDRSCRCVSTRDDTANPNDASLATKSGCLAFLDARL